MLRIIEAGSDPQSKKILSVKVGVIERVDVGAQSFTQGVSQFALVMDGRDCVQVRAKRREAFGLDRGFVHVRVEEIRNFARARACGRVGLGNLFDQVRSTLIAEVAQLGKDVDLGAIGRNFSALDPIAVGVQVKIISRLDRDIDVSDSDSVVFWRGCILRAPHQGTHRHAK